MNCLILRDELVHVATLPIRVGLIVLIHVLLVPLLILLVRLVG